jgi:hypothetical protein
MLPTLGGEVRHPSNPAPCVFNVRLQALQVSAPRTETLASADSAVSALQGIDKTRALWNRARHS